MNDTRRAKQNSKILAPMGLIEVGEWTGQPRYQFKRIGDLYIARRKPEVMQKVGSLWVPNAAEWEWVPQFPPPDGLVIGNERMHWCIARWMPPSYSEDEWQTRFGNILAYPRNGTWFLEVPLKYLPDEDWTQGMLRVLQHQAESTVLDRFNASEEGIEKREKKYQADVADLSNENFVNHVPGKRGGDFSVPQTKFDR